MANAIISQVNIGKTLYDIYDANAVHNISDLGLQGALVFRGAVASVSGLPASGSAGDVYHVVDVDSEYIWVQDDNPAVAGHWEEFGSKLMIEHTHDIPALSGSIGSNGSAAAQKWTQQSGTINGTAAAQTWTQDTTNSSVTVSGSNAASNVTASGTVSVPTVDKTAKYSKVSTQSDSFVTSYPGATSKLVTTSVNSAGASTAVVNSVTATPSEVTGVSGSTTASKVSSTTGSQAKWSASVTNGILSFSWTANTPTTVSAEDVTVPKAAAQATPVVTSVTSGTTNVAGVGTPITVATGSLNSNGSGGTVMTGLGTAKKTTALTSATLVAATGSNDGIHTGDSVSIGATNKTVNVAGTADAQKWTPGACSVTIKGTNASSTVSGSATVTGTNAASKVTGSISTVANVTGKPE